MTQLGMMDEGKIVSQVAKIVPATFFLVDKRIAFGFSTYPPLLPMYGSVGTENFCHRRITETIWSIFSTLTFMQSFFINLADISSKMCCGEPTELHFRLV